jgi:hypothetical protein
MFLDPSLFSYFLILRFVRAKSIYKQAVFIPKEHWPFNLFVLYCHTNKTTILSCPIIVPFYSFTPLVFKYTFVPKLQCITLFIIDRSLVSQFMIKTVYTTYVCKYMTHFKLFLITIIAFWARHV